MPIPIFPKLWRDKSGGVKLQDSDFLNGLEYKAAMTAVIQHIEEKGCGEGTINYRLRDAIFSRQRYWGEPIPVYYKNGLPVPLDEKHLPLNCLRSEPFAHC